METAILWVLIPLALEVTLSSVAENRISGSVELLSISFSAINTPFETSLTRPFSEILDFGKTSNREKAPSIEPKAYAIS